MPFLRWLVPVVAALAIMASAVTSWAAAGIRGDVSCCCPEPSECNCHDHDDAPRPASEMKKCGSEVERVAPTILCAVAASSPMPCADVVVARVITPAPFPIPDDRSIELEIPPS